MSSSPDGSFAAVQARVRAAVEAVAATDPHPLDPFRGLYVDDATALALARGPACDADARLASSATLLGLSPLETSVLALCTAPELDPRFGRLYAYLHDDVTRKLPSPRLV